MLWIGGKKEAEVLALQEEIGCYIGRYDLIDCHLAAFFNYIISECTISNFLDFISIPHANTSFPERWHCSLKQIVSERT